VSAEHKWERRIYVPDNLRTQFACRADTDLDELATLVDQAIQRSAPQDSTVKMAQRQGWSVEASEWYVQRAYLIGKGFYPKSFMSSILGDYKETKPRTEIKRLSVTGIVATVLLIGIVSGLKYASPAVQGIAGLPIAAILLGRYLFRGI
jgi:hypothetical protein